jgi:Cys-tRNA(Pro)/Cys-tRNA(Cys) deacylase
MSRTTPATQFLTRQGIAFTVHTYAYDPQADRVGMQAAEALGEEPRRVLKTLMTEVDGNPVCVMLPSDGEVSMKRLAALFGGKTAAMMKPGDAERSTGYRVGGISPFGQRKAVPAAIEEGALSHPLIYLNGGQRGLQLRLDPHDVVRVLQAKVAALVA